MASKPVRRVVPTSNDVARESGVSQSTVSYVMSGKRSISTKTRRRVEEAMERLDFQPNSRARALASQRTQVLGIVVPFRPELDMAVIMQFVGAIATAARKIDYDVLLVTDDEGPEGLRRLQGTAMCDAIILMDVATEDPRLPVARKMGIPVVLIGIPDDHTGHTCVDLDFEAAGRLALEELAELGHRQVGLVTPSAENPQRDANFIRRFRRGISGVAQDRGVEIITATACADYRSATNAVRQIFSESPGITAIVIHNSHVVEPVVAALDREGHRTGREVAVIAVCSDTVAERQTVKLTSIPLEPERVSNLAVQLAMQLLEQPGELATPRIHLIEPRIVRRHSTFTARCPQ